MNFIIEDIFNTLKIERMEKGFLDDKRKEVWQFTRLG